MGEFEYTFTVFTPTYNRAATLSRVRDSLDAQTYRDFEWIVVDDGSTDGTKELVEGWQRDAWFPIRYFRQPNSGKHVAFNRGVQAAKGAFFLTLDSDDACDPEALERLLYWWEQIPESEREGFSAVTGQCRDQHGRALGTPYPRSPLDCGAIEARWRYRVKGEKWGFQRTDVLRQHPFPEPDGVKFVSESLVWRAIDVAGYKTRFVNETWRTYWMDEEGKGSLTEITPKVLEGRMMVHAQTLNELGSWVRVNPTAFASAAINLSRYGLARGMRPPAIVGLARPLWAKALVAVLLPAGALASARDRWRRPAGHGAQAVSGSDDASGPESPGA